MTWPRYEFARRLGSDWRDLADALEILDHIRRRFIPGEEPGGIWEFLAARNRLPELTPALVGIGRQDLAELLTSPLDGGARAYLDFASRSMLPLGNTDVLHNPDLAYVPTYCADSTTDGPVETAMSFLDRALDTKRVALVVGNYGAGKSFLARRLFLEKSREYQRATTVNAGRLPVLLPLRRVAAFSKTQLLAHLVEHLHYFGYFAGVGSPGAAEHDQVWRMLDGGQLLCILDGFDEVPLLALGGRPVDELRRLVDVVSVGHNRAVITSRPGELAGILDPNFAASSPYWTIGHLLPWRPEEDWQRYLNMCTRNGVVVETRFVAQVAAHPELRQLTATPLYCQMLVESKDAITDVQDLNVGKLYDLYTDQYFARMSDRSRLRGIITIPSELIEYEHDCLGATAVGMLERGKARLKAAEIVESLRAVARRYDVALLKEFAKIDTLVYSLLVVDILDTYSFSHRSFYDYYVARVIHQQLVGAAAQLTLMERFTLSNETIAFLADRLTPDTPFAQRLQRTFGCNHCRECRRFTASPSTDALIVTTNQRLLRRNLAVLQLELTRCLRPELDLEDLDFRGYNFAAKPGTVTLAGVNLNGCQFEGAILAGADLRGAGLRAARLNHAVLDGADLRRARCEGAYTDGISCKETRFSEALGLGTLQQRPHNAARICAALWQERDIHGDEVDPDQFAQALADLGCR